MEFAADGSIRTVVPTLESIDPVKHRGGYSTK
jgi:hypothetical protein